MRLPQQLVPLFALFFVAYSFSAGQERKAISTRVPISVATLQRSTVIGLLGHPLGTVLRVTGKSVDGDETRRRRDAGHTLLKVETVNGKQLSSPVYFTFGRAADGVEQPRAGVPFDYHVHEWGSFDGVVDIPTELGIEKPIIAHDGFFYRPELTIHKSHLVPPRRQQEQWNSP